ncbi:MAG TPA: SulP family inorganic anion transporter [Casimicrobiaceae bacterium]|nr:SulP family inorganic anion transporter [Casimicrobiaceae bacterium]
MPPLLVRIVPFLAWRERVNSATLRADAIAGLIGGLVVLPQGIAYATLAGLPPQYGLYCAMVPVVVAALWGSSWHMISGPTNALSLVVFATVAPLAAPGSESYITLALTLCLIVGLAQLAMGLAGLGALVNFISHTVIVGFTAGAALLIIASQIRNFLGIPAPATTGFFATLRETFSRIDQLNVTVALTGVVTLAIAIAARRWLPRIPYMIVAMIAGSVFAFAVTRVTGTPVPVVGSLPDALPPLSLPSFDPAVWRSVAPAALALTVLGLTEAVSIARAMALRSGQRIDGNREFVGQGLSNVAGAFFSAYPSSGSFNRSGVNYEAGAKTPLAALFSAVALAIVLLAVGPLAAWLPFAVMAALLFIVGFGLIDFAEIRRILRANRPDAMVLVVTFIATLTLELEFAIFVGVLVSLFAYLYRTTHPRLTRIASDAATGRFVAASAAAPPHPHVDMLRVDGSLFFGAVEHVRDEVERLRHERPHIRELVLVCTGVNFIDVAGAELLAHLARELKASGATLHLSNVKPDVRNVLERSGALAVLDERNLHETQADALAAGARRLQEKPA